MKYTLFVVLCLLSTTTTHAQMDTLNGEPVYTIVEEMPYPIDCESAEDKNRCRDEYIGSFIFSTISYPSEAITTATEGMSITTFIINKNGKMVQVETIRDPGAGLGEEAKRVIELMGEETIWIAGKHKGEPVNIRFTIPLRLHPK